MKASSNSTERRLWLLRVLVPLVTIVATLLLAELALRLPGLEQLVDIEPVLRGGPLVYEPNQVARQRLGGEFDAEIRVNSRGLRDVEFIPEANGHRIVALGDSFTEGWGVSLAQTWPKQLERLLTQAGSGYDHVFNAGRSGTNPKNYAALYREVFASDSSVNLVVAGIFLANDIVEPSTPEYRVPPPRTTLQRLKFFLARNSAVYNLLRRTRRQSLAVETLLSKIGMAEMHAIPLDFANSDLNRRRWRYTAEYLTEFASRVRADGKQILFVLVPAKEQVIEGYVDTVLDRAGIPDADLDLFGFRDYVLEYLRANDVDVLDLTPKLLDASTPDPVTLYFRGDGHWNAEGHRVAAEAIVEYLRDAGLLLEEHGNVRAQIEGPHIHPAAE
jgi:lysophospholipase L1-like esterase